jgi:hypothetical protein
MIIEEDVKIFGRTSRDTWEVTEYEPPTVVAYRAYSLAGLFVSDVSPSRAAPDSRTLWNMSRAVSTTRR